jgi:hypothetical protein
VRRVQRFDNKIADSSFSCFKNFRFDVFFRQHFDNIGICQNDRRFVFVENLFQRIAVNMIGMLMRDNDCLNILKLIRFNQAFGKREKSGIEKYFIGIFFDLQTRVNIFCDFHFPSLK